MKKIYKIGILTFHCADNYGAVLQAFALQSVIEALGVKAEIIDYRPEKLIETYRIKKPDKFNFINYGKYIAVKSLFSKKFEKRVKLYDEFRNNYLKLSKSRYFKSLEIEKNPPEYDIYIVGSDQVWNPKHIEQYGHAYLLNFVQKKTKRISYAASVVERIPDYLINIYKENLNKFDSISVREKSSKNILKEIIDKHISVVVDPVLLIEKSRWDDLIKGVKKSADDYIFVYDLVKDELIYKTANYLSLKTHLPVITFSYNFYKNLYSNYIGSIYFKGPEDFIWCIKNAKFVLTNSYHGFIFSLIYEKPFIVLPHPTRGSRMRYLLDELGIPEKLIDNENDVPKKINEIDNIKYENIKYKINLLKESSVSYLKKAILI
jgi:hypothetical protein